MRDATEDVPKSPIGRALLLVGLIAATAVLSSGCQSPPAGAREPAESETANQPNSTGEPDTRTKQSTSAADDEGANVEPLAPHAWKHRPVVVFAPDPNHETFQQQMEVFESHRTGLEDRDIVVYRVFENNRPRGPDDTRSLDVAEALRERFQPGEPFTVVLVGKDTTEKLRSEELLTVQKLFDTIDAMPMRQREMQRDD